MPERPKAKPCPSCAKPIRPDAAKCWFCGEVFNTVPCVECSSPVQKGSTSCWFCGAAIEGRTPSSAKVTEHLPPTPGPGASETIQTSPRPNWPTQEPPVLEVAGIKNCPRCDAEVPLSATKCRECGGELAPGGAGKHWLRRVGYEPHRGGSVLTLAILSLVCCGLIFGPIAWTQANHDLRAMQEGRMDPSGEGITRAAQIIAAISTLLTLAWVGLNVLAAMARF
jgi:hypothetical protein